MVLEDYTPELIYIPGNMHVIADMLSCLDKDNDSKLSRSDNTLFLVAKALTASDIKGLKRKEINLFFKVNSNRSQSKLMLLTS